MKTGYGLWATALLGLSLQCGCHSSAHYGNSFRLQNRDTVSVAQVISDKQDYRDQYVRVRGKVAEVCRPRGCWLTMNDGQGGEVIYVKFNCPVEGRLIPLDAVGRDVVVEGELKLEEITEDAARHFAEDAGLGPQAVAQIVGPQRQVRISAPGARLAAH